jgi:stearoyl-CoA desaturase (delta-9 desaturase)
MNRAAEPLVPASVGRVIPDPVRAAWLWSMLAVGLVAGLPALTPGRTTASFTLAFLTLCLGHSVGLHRGLIHRTYESARWLRGLLAWLFVLSGLGGPLAWARLHAVRDHWQSRPDCPRYFAYDHSLARDFVWNLHLRFVPADARAEERLPPDVLGDPWLRFLDRTWPLHVLALAVLLYLQDGPGAVAVCLCARTAAGILGHWFIGYAAHRWGRRPHVVAGAKESGTNVWILGLLSFGEGFHNNHHAFPRSARMGLQAHELDLGWLVLRLLRRLGLVHDVREAGVGAGAPAFSPRTRGGVPRSRSRAPRA